MGEVFSEEKQPEMSVPQVSVLSVTQFNVKINQSVLCMWMTFRSATDQEAQQIDYRE